LSVQLDADRGVFAGGAVDAGTKLLLSSVPMSEDLTGDVLDLGCGYGPIAITAALRAPRVRVWAIDVNERALSLTRANAHRLGVGGRVHAVRGAEVPGDIRFAAIYANPPIRVGKQALHELLATWLVRLAEGASAHLVVHKHLGSDSLAKWLELQGHDVERTVSRMGYRVLRVQTR
jgi:16S rRNA (guanine1207-N2)-methyltransferase